MARCTFVTLLILLVLSFVHCDAFGFPYGKEEHATEGVIRVRNPLSKDNLAKNNEELAIVHQILERVPLIDGYYWLN